MIEVNGEFFAKSSEIAHAIPETDISSVLSSLPVYKFVNGIATITPVELQDSSLINVNSSSEVLADLELVLYLRGMIRLVSHYRSSSHFAFKETRWLSVNGHFSQNALKYALLPPTREESKTAYLFLINNAELQKITQKEEPSENSYLSRDLCDYFRVTQCETALHALGIDFDIKNQIRTQTKFSWEFDSDSPYWPEELDIALTAWRAVSNQEIPPKNPKKAITDWLDSNGYVNLPNEAKKRIAIVCNWNKAGGREKEE